MTDINDVRDAYMEMLERAEVYVSAVIAGESDELFTIVEQLGMLKAVSVLLDYIDKHCEPRPTSKG